MSDPAINDPPSLSPAMKERLFPAERPLPEDPATFELGLVLAGTVSAGAYTGGVLDMLIEALDAWTVARDGGSEGIPLHRVVLSTVGGTSGGAINGAILARASGYAFPHGKDPANPFLDAWTRTVGLKPLLSVGSVKASDDLISILNCDSIETQARSTVGYVGGALGTLDTPRRRSYLGDPLRLIMMVTNVTGVPYRIDMQGESGLAHDLVAHADWMRFGITTDGGMPDRDGAREDEVALAHGSDLNWNDLADAALATSAFPFVFRSRPLDRPLARFGLRAVLLPGGGSQPARVATLQPRWAALRANQQNPEQPSFVTVDGGVTNNQPLDAVRMALAGVAGTNPRNGHEARRAVVMVDPFADPVDLGPTTPPGLFKLVWPFIQSLMFQARFKPEDIALAVDDSVYSRFLIAPLGLDGTGQPAAGANAIASGGLSGFLGFVDPSFLTYDYMLGRWNAYRFLQEQFVFPENNAVFVAANWSEALKQRWCVRDAKGAPVTKDGQRMLPMIPLMPTVKAQAPAPAEWPRLPEEKTDWLDDAVGARLDLLFGQVKASIRPDSWLARTLLSVSLDAAWGLAKRSIRDDLVGAVRNGLKAQNLL